MKEGGKAIEKMRKKYESRRQIIVDGLNDIHGFTCNKPNSTFYTFPRIDFDMDSMEFALHLLKEAKVATTPGSAFGEQGEDHLRMSFANSSDNIKEALDRIENVVENL